MLSIITGGIYAIYWMYLLVKNVRALKQDNSSCTGEMLCLLFVPFYALYWWYTRGNDVKSLLDARDYHISSTGTLYLVLSIFGLGIVAMAIMQNDFNALSFADSVTQSNQRGAKKTFGYRVNIFLFLLPALVLFIGILIAPIITSTYYSLYDGNSLTGDIKFVGFDNYVSVFTDNTYNLKKPIVNALLLAACSTFLQLPLALWIALKLAKGIRGERVFLSVFFMPVLISTVVIGQLWMKIYDGNHGLITSILRSLGIWDKRETIVWLGTDKQLLVDGKYVRSKHDYALWATFLPILWQYVGYHMLLMFAGIKGVPPELCEAAMIDGCTEGQMNRHIVIPYIKPILRVSVIFAVTGSLKSYDMIKVLTDGGPAQKTEVPSIVLEKLMFQANSVGRGSAVAVIMIVLCFAFALLINFVFRKDDVV